MNAPGPGRRLRNLLFWSWAAVWAAMSSACSVTRIGGPEDPRALAPAGQFDVQKDRVYTTPDWPEPLRADIYTPQGAGPFPAVLVVHGGGWRRGTRGEMDHICKRLAGQGFIAVSIDYRLAPASTFPAALEDLQQAVRWMHANAAEQHIDAQRIAVWGYSAGAQLAALLGVLSPGDPHFSEGTRVRAVVSGGTPVDLRFAAKSSLVQQFIGARIEQAPALYRQASPIAFVSADDPPMFLYHGGMDWVVGDINARRMHDALAGAGVPTELYLIHGTGHIGAYFNRGAIDAGIAFLQRQLR